MKFLLPIFVFTVGFTSALPVAAQQASPLNEPATRATLGVKPPRNPVKSSAPIVRRTYERKAVKGIGVETGAAEPQAIIEVDVEVVHRSDGTMEERPFVPLPILFVVSRDVLLDETSRANADKMAGILRDLVTQQGARFTIQGHTSAEGDAAANQTLSEARASRIHAMLLAKGVPASSLAMIGLGEDCAQSPETAPESSRQLDRRVLIVRMK